MSESRMSTIDKRFTRIADAVTEFVGRWWFSTFSLLALLLWTLYGVLILRGDWFTSTTWNFPLNTITTAGEWLLEGLILAAANRVERRHDQLLYEIKARASADLHVTAEDAETNKAAKEDIESIKRELVAIREALQHAHE